MKALEGASSKSAGALREYWSKRDFRRTPEPAGRAGTHATQELQYCIQRHDARRLHYDFRLEWNGVLKSWAVPKGPSMDASVKRLAVETEDHPIKYNRCSGIIPQGEYGAGTVEIWDRGTWTPQGDASRGLREGKLKVSLDGERLFGDWTLVRLKQEQLAADEVGCTSSSRSRRRGGPPGPKRPNSADRFRSILRGRFPRCSRPG